MTFQGQAVIVLGSLLAAKHSDIRGGHDIVFTRIRARAEPALGKDSRRCVTVEVAVTAAALGCSRRCARGRPWSGITTAPTARWRRRRCTVAAPCDARVRLLPPTPAAACVPRTAERLAVGRDNTCAAGWGAGGECEGRVKWVANIWVWLRESHMSQLPAQRKVEDAG